MGSLQTSESASKGFSCLFSLWSIVFSTVSVHRVKPDMDNFSRSEYFARTIRSLNNLMLEYGVMLWGRPTQSAVCQVGVVPPQPSRQAWLGSQLPQHVLSLSDVGQWWEHTKSAVCYRTISWRDKLHGGNPLSWCGRFGITMGSVNLSWALQAALTARVILASAQGVRIKRASAALCLSDLCSKYSTAGSKWSPKTSALW